MMASVRSLGIALTLGATALANSNILAEAAPPQARKPNILLIVADDLGFTDLGAFGSEIPTPTLDSLAQSGIVLTNFYTAPACSPTRAMLMSGTDNHLAGLGTMAEFLNAAAPVVRGKPGYEGFLNDRVAPLPRLLRDAGYDTFMAGKWHLGKSKQHSPAARGFDKSFVLLEGGAGHFNDLGLTADEPTATYREDGELVELPKDFYSTRFYAERLIRYLRSRENGDKPFFAYLAYSAPHWPLQAPDESIARHKGRYSKGYRAVLTERLERQKALGLIPVDADIERYTTMLPAWESLSTEERMVAERRMEIYAAMIDDLDRYTGSVIDAIQRMGQMDNTLIIFMSDNGAMDKGMPQFHRWAAQCCDNSYDNMGKPDSYLFAGDEWARVSTGILRGLKGQTTEGGIRVPAIIYYPPSSTRGVQYGHFLSVMDVLPTLLDVAGQEHPGTRYHGREVHPVKGRSFAPLIFGDQAPVQDGDYSMGWELFGGKALRQGDWKLVFDPKPKGDSRWHLYNLAEDPAESQDLAERESERLKTMIALWEQYVQDNGVMVQH